MNKVRKCWNFLSKEIAVNVAIEWVLILAGAVIGYFVYGKFKI
jgi:hypothetical protein